MLPQKWQLFKKLKLLTSAQLTGREDVRASGSRSDRMQRHQMGREIIDCNMITWIMMMAKMEGLKGSSMPPLAAAAEGNAFVGMMETGP